MSYHILWGVCCPYLRPYWDPPGCVCFSPRGVRLTEIFHPTPVRLKEEYVFENCGHRMHRGYACIVTAPCSSHSPIPQPSDTDILKAYKPSFTDEEDMANWERFRWKTAKEDLKRIWTYEVPVARVRGRQIRWKKHVLDRLPSFKKPSSYPECLAYMSDAIGEELGASDRSLYNSGTSEQKLDISKLGDPDDRWSSWIWLDLWWQSHSK